MHPSLDPYPTWRRLRRFGYRLLALFVLLIIGAATVILFTGWRALFPGHLTTTERLGMFPAESPPLEHHVSIHWDQHQIPYILATTDHDVALALGMVHAHLREAQVAVFKRLAQGRLSEMAGPVAVDIDVALRTLDLGHAVDDMARTMPTDTRDWIEPYLEGFNFYKDHTRKTPPEFGLLGLRREPYTMRDLLTLSRLAGADVNWFSWFPLLRARRQANWPDIWKQVLELGTGGTPSIKESKSLDELRRLLSISSHTGSNSLVVSGKKAANGRGMIASDPHLGISVPNFWMLVGIKSPSYNCVGMMIPGLPFFALGRNPHLAWGGTNMRSASSNLYDVSNQPSDSFESRTEHIKVRFWRDRDFTVRWSSHGPVLSDARLIPTQPDEALALKWVGHEPSDDIGAFLRANRATNVEEFVKAFESYAVSGQNMLAVDTNGNIAMTMAVKLPERQYDTPPDLVLDAADPQHQWQGFRNATQLPLAVNPPAGFICSSNNMPAELTPPVGYLYSLPDRFNRITYLLGAVETVDLNYLTALQRDVFSRTALDLNTRLKYLIDSLGLDDPESSIQRTLESWDGYYSGTSEGALAFELLTFHILQGGANANRLGGYAHSWNYVAMRLAADLEALSTTVSKKLIDTALVLAQGDFDRFRNWGDIHHLKAAYLLSWLPLVGNRFVYADCPASGSRETVMKTSHEFTNQRHASSYGSQSRHISLMDDPDHNYFVLFGGNDGWLGSANLVDNVPLWRTGQYIQLPLRPESAKRAAKYSMTLAPDEPTCITENPPER